MQMFNGIFCEFRFSLPPSFLFDFLFFLESKGSKRKSIAGKLFFCAFGGLANVQRKTDGSHSWVYVRQYCAKIDEAARNRMELIVRSLAEQNGVTEQLKAENQMEWVRQMNACKAQAEEIVKAELIYD